MTTQESYQILNELDELGLLKGLRRFPDESSKDFRKRIIDSIKNPSGPDFAGMINGITRELGLSQYKACKIIPPDNDPKAYVKIGSTNISLIRGDGVIVKEIDKFSYDVLYLYKLRDFINNSGTFFSCELFSADLQYSFSKELFPQSNLVESSIDYRGGTEVLLPYKKIIGVDLSISTNPEEKSSIGELKKYGDYYIEYFDTNRNDYAWLHLYSELEDFARITVRRIDLDSHFKASPVVIRKFHDEEFKNILFEEVSSERGYPTDLGESLFNEAFTVYPLYWGK